MDTTYSLKLPPKNYRRIIEELSVVIPDPALKLKFLKQAIDEHQKISPTHKLYPPIAVVSFRKKLLDHAEKIWPGSKKAAKHLIRKGTDSTPHNKILWLYKLRYAIGSVILMFLIWGVGTAVSPLVRSFTYDNLVNLNSAQTRTSITKIIIRKPIIGDQRPRNGNSPSSSIIVKSVNYQNGTDLVLKYFQNPILIALASQQIKKPKPNYKSQKPIGSFQFYDSENKPILTTFNPDKQQKDPKLVLNHFQNPILIALASRQTKKSKPNRIFQEPLWPIKTHNSENDLTLSLDPIDPIKSENHQNDPELVLNHFQSPILLALTSQQTIYSKPTHIEQRSILSSQIHSSGSQSAVADIKPVNHLTGTQRVLKYHQNPVLIALASQQITISKPDRIIRKPILSSQPSESENDSPSAEVQAAKYANKPVKVPKYLKAPIWLVEKTSDREFYSNRLQIITTHTISNIPREYYRFPKKSNYMPVNSKIADKISGIVYHASESDLYPFMPEMNHSILKYSKQLIRYLQRKKSYHFFIDRFGRVYRLVREDHAAFHAGNSIWADDKEIYLNLNHAFIGICFEGKDFEEINIKKQKKGQSKKSKQPRLRPTGISSFNEAQLRSGKELTDWLRVKYNIPQQNCVPHALISVNPHRMLIGYHLDLARGFPFAKFGLSDKYQEPLPSMVEFGFLYDNYFEKIFNGKLWRGIRFSEEILQRKAENSGMSFSDYRKSLQRRFSRYAEWNKKMLETKDQLAQNQKKN